MEDSTMRTCYSILLLLLLNIQASLPQTATWVEGQFVNWLQVKRYIPNGNRLLTSQGNVFTYDESIATWIRDAIFADKHVHDMVYSDEWVLYLPSGDLHHRTSGERLNVRERFDSLEIQNAAFDRNNLAVATNSEFVLIDLEEMQIAKRKMYEGGVGPDDEFFFHGEKVCYRTSGQLYIHDLTNDSFSRKYVYSAGGQSSSIQKIHSSSRIPLCSLNEVVEYDFLDDSIRTVFTARPYDGVSEEYIVSVYATSENIYVATQDEPYDGATIYELDATAATGREIAFIRERDGTGNMACDILHVTPTQLTIADRDGGLYKYGRDDDSYVWHGNGISEALVSGCANYKDGIIAYYGAALDLYDHRSHERVFLPSMLLTLGADIGMYQDYIVTDINGILYLFHLYDQSDRILISMDARSCIVLGDSVVMYSDHGGTYSFRDHDTKIAACVHCQLAADEQQLGMYSPGTGIVINDLRSGVSRTYEAPAGSNLKLVSMRDSAMVFSTGTVLFSYNYFDTRKQWEVEGDFRFVKEIEWCGDGYLVAQDGKFISIDDGSISYHIPSGIRQVVVSRDTCFVFYPFRNTLFGAKCATNSFQNARDHRRNGDIAIIPTANREQFDIIAHVPEYRSTTIVLYDMLGTKRKVLFDGFTGPGAFHVPLSTSHLPSGTYIVVMHHGATTAVTKMLVTK
jgi:hypothetical protein